MPVCSACSASFSPPHYENRMPSDIEVRTAVLELLAHEIGHLIADPQQPISATSQPVVSPELIRGAIEKLAGIADRNRRLNGA